MNYIFKYCKKEIKEGEGGLPNFVLCKTREEENWIDGKVKK